MWDKRLSLSLHQCTKTSDINLFRVASDRFRLARHRYNQVILAVCGLVRLRINRLFSVTFSTEFAICKFIYADSTFLL
ncbi:MAG: hypothetical protein KME52_01630 [Desmonostoc geniculatum HA4340-LM1]|nr:hypothetical protein [Desmonostoc geniculatum HA4340-LM1]